MDHEYNVLFRNVSEQIKQLEDSNGSQDQDALNHLRLSFHSLEEKLRFFSPLYRSKLGRVTDVTGEDIRTFIEALYSEDKRDGMKITYTSRFLTRTLTDVNKPVVLAATANLISNSIYWTTRGSAEREVRFSSVANGFVISDSGPGIAERDRNRIFDAFFSRRPHGRGLGLYIANEPGR